MTGFELAITCLALNVFKEARGEAVSGQLAVAMVTLNRARIAPHNDICATVFEDKQFSWTITDAKDGVLVKGRKPNRKSAEWKLAERAALTALEMKDFTGGATHYHHIDVRPYWAKHFEYVGRWGDHHFYRGDYK